MRKETGAEKREGKGGKKCIKKSRKGGQGVQETEGEGGAASALKREGKGGRKCIKKGKKGGQGDVGGL